jgi:hypothetical protein
VLDWRERFSVLAAAAVQADVVARVKCTRSPLLSPRIMSLATVRLEEPASAVGRADCLSLVVAPTEGGSGGPQCLSLPSRPLV